MTAPFKILIVGGGIAGLSLAIMLEEYGFEYELLEKHASVAPKLGAGVGLTPNGARILDQIGVWKAMCDAGSPMSSGTAVSPDGSILIHNDNMGNWMNKLFGYNLQFVSRYNCLSILYNRIQRKGNIHLSQELRKVEIVGEKVKVETTDGVVYTGDILIGADGVRSNVRRELWRIADDQHPGYVSKRDKTALESAYTAVVGVARDVPELPRGDSVRAYNYHRSYFFQEGRPGTGEFYWWLCVKNDKKGNGTLHGLASNAKQLLVEKYKNDKIWPGMTFEDLHKRSIYSAIIPLEEFVLEKCFYKNIFLLGDSFRKLHPVAGQGANSAFEESALLADLLWDLRARKALQDQVSIQQSFSAFQDVRSTRLQALLEDAHLVQQMESLDDPILKFMALYVMPKLNFAVTFLPQLGASFVPGGRLKHLLPPKMGIWPFAPEIKMRPKARSFIATVSWTVFLFLAASIPLGVSKYLSANNNLTTTPNASTSDLNRSLHLYISLVKISLSGLWVTESYRADSLLSPLSSATPFILASNYLGWEFVVPIYFFLHIRQSRGIAYYHMPRTMTDLGIAKALLIALILVYAAPVFQSLQGTKVFTGYSWEMAHLAFPLAAFACGKILGAITTMPSNIEVVFSNMDIPYQKQFYNILMVITTALHLFSTITYGSQLLETGVELFLFPLTRKLLSLVAVTTTWCMYTAWELGRVNAIDISVVQAWIDILLGTIVCGPAATLACTWFWRATQLVKAKSYQPKTKVGDKKISWMSTGV